MAPVGRAHDTQHLRRDFLGAILELFAPLSYSRWRLQFALFCSVLVLGASAVLAQVQPGTTNKCEAMVSVKQIRMLTTEAVRPAYPDEAIRAGTTGLVVAEICAPLDGRPVSIKISSAPSEILARAVKTAISKWKFRTRADENDPLAFGGKVVFYFLKQDDKWKVLDPMESFYIGPRFALKQQHPLPDSELFSWPEGAFSRETMTRKEK